MSENKPGAAEWRDRCHAALDMMRDDPEGAQRIGLAMLAEVRADAGLATQWDDAQPLAGLAPAEQRKYLSGQLVSAFVDFFQGRHKPAEAEFNRLEAAFNLLNDQRSIALCLFGKMSIWRTVGRTRDAYELGYAHALPIIAHFATREKVMVLNAMGVIAQEYDKTEEAIRHFHGALEIARKLELPNRVAQITANIGEILYMSGNSEDAEKMLEEANELAAHANERWLAPFVASLLALCKIGMAKYEQAYDAISHFLPTIDTDIGVDLSNRGFCLSVAAYTLAMRDRLDEAEQFCDAAVALLDHYEAKQEKPYTWWALGHLHHRRGRLPEAIHALTLAIDLNGSLGFVFMPQRALRELADIHEEQGDWEAAYRAQQRYHAMYARAQNQSVRAQLQILHIQGELKEAESARRHAEANMTERDTILDNSMVGIVFLNAQGMVQWSNRAMSEMLGAPHGDNLGLSFEQYFPSRAEYRKMGAIVIDTVSRKNTFETEYQMRRRDGSLFWAWISGRAVDPNDPVRGTVWVALDISRRRQLEEDLHKSEEQHRQVLDNVTEGIIVVQNDFIVFANPRILQLTGSTSEQVFGKSFAHSVHADDRPKVMEQHVRRLRGDEVEQYYSFRIRNESNGDYRWVELSGVTIQWESQPATLAFISDITDRKRLEENLKQSLVERDIILENSMVGIAFLNGQGRVQWANRTMNDMLGAANNDNKNLSLEPFYASREDYLKTGGAAAEAIAQGLPYETELRLLRQDGSLFWAWISGRSVQQNDLTQGTVWVVVDIDKRRRLEEELLKSEEHHRQVVDNVTEGIMVTQRGKIVFANPRVAQISGRTLDDLFAMPALIDVHPDDVEMVERENDKRLRGETNNKYYAFRIVHHKTGAVRWIELSAVLIDWEGLPASLAFLTDITERRKLEHSLKESHLERVRLQTLQFETELKEAEVARMHAEETTKAKSMFLANMSHEIRTPMNAIIGMAHLALRSQLEPKQRDYVEKIHGAGISLLGIINDILDFSKIEAGKLAFETVDFNLDSVLNNVSTITSGKAQEKRLEYLFQIPFEIPRNLIGDPLRLGQVLINLINNAIKFTERGDVTVACILRALSGDEVELEFVVSDTGIGMSDEQISRLFRAFSQADETTTRKYGGTGLGLSISQGMVELMGGRIWLDSKDKGGTRVHFTAKFGLPVAQQRRIVAPAELEGMHVLVVDDNPAARAVLADILARLPITVDFADGGKAALAAIHAHDDASAPYDIVFTDLEMPGFDGIELICEVKKEGALHTPPRMVLISAHGNESVRYRPEGSLADGFLLKPVNAALVIDSVVQLFSNNLSTPPPRRREALPHFQDLSILLVEDNQINQQIAAELMQATGIAVEVAGNGRIAVERLREAGPAHFGMVFMDVQMPEMDGHQATRLIRQDPLFADLPIVAMTAHAMQEERDACMASGMNDHISKPIDPDTVYHAIARWCPLHLEAAQRHADKVASFMAEFDADTGYEDDEPAEQTPVTLVIAGIDVADGLVRTLGNQVFYLQLLARFRDGQRDAALKIRAALQSGERGDAERLAHTLKGVAGMLGAKDVSLQAGQLETLLRGETPEAALLTLLDKLAQDMAALDAAMALVLPAADDEADQAAADSEAPMQNREAEAALLDHLAELLSQSDGDAIDLLDNCAALLRSCLGAATQREIAQAAQQFEFDTALTVLIAAAGSNGHDLTRYSITQAAK